MNAEELKEYIKEDTDRIVKILESVGCHSVWRSGDEIRCASPDSNNHTAVVVNIKTLGARHYSASETVVGDIFTLVQHFRDEDFKDSFRFTKALFGIGGSYNKTQRIDPLAYFKGIRKNSGGNIITNLDELEIRKFNKSILNDFVIMPHMSLFYEGITPQTQELFKIGYDSKLDRVVFPHTNYDSLDDIVGITGRTLKSKEEQQMFGIPKYFNYIKGYKKMYNLYGFSHALPYIEKHKIVILFEGEKSVLKQFSQTRNRGYAVSVGGHEISQVQTQILLRHTPLDTEIVIAFDKDVMNMTNSDGENIGEEFLVKQCNKFSKFRKTSYIFDKYNILGEKDAPIDKGYKVWNYLLKYRKKV